MKQASSKCPKCGSENTWSEDTHLNYETNPPTFYDYRCCDECGALYSDVYELAGQFIAEY